LKRHKEYVAEEKTRTEQALRKQREAILKQQTEALNLSERVHKALVDAGLVSIGEVVKKLEAGDAGLLAVEGIGPKALEEVKDRLQAIGLIPA
jgi:DNA-directed RNA polymerase alpha subunit